MRRDAAALADPIGPGASSPADRTIVHASCVSLGGRGIVLLGRPGSGKSDLALRLIDGGAELVADDQLVVERTRDRLTGRAPEALAGLLEVRGIGILRLPWRSAATLNLAVRLTPAEAIPRLPDPAVHTLLGVELPCVQIDARSPSAAAAVRLAAFSRRVA